MSHPHKFLLDEFQVAIDHFVPTISEETVKEAQALHDKFVANEAVDRKEIAEGMIVIGKKTFAFRNAFHDFASGQIEQLLHGKVMEALDPMLQKKIGELLKPDQQITLLVKDTLFEKRFSAGERRAIEEKLLDTKKQLLEEVFSEVVAGSEGYDNMLKHWQGHQLKIELAIDQLEVLAQTAGQWQDEIEQKVVEFREGFLVTERDPELEEIVQAIDYWKGVVAEGK